VNSATGDKLPRGRIVAQARLKNDGGPAFAQCFDVKILTVDSEYGLATGDLPWKDNSEKRR
jgi:hypothetical protein